tara:strand:- start:4497 stop:4718 length:222 start_codon:yes stop_codon:yes gene_type:complete
MTSPLDKQWLYKDGEQYKFKPEDVVDALNNGWHRKGEEPIGALPDVQKETLKAKPKKKRKKAFKWRNSGRDFS